MGKIFQASSIERVVEWSGCLSSSPLPQTKKTQHSLDLLAGDLIPISTNTTRWFFCSAFSSLLLKNCAKPVYKRSSPNHWSVIVSYSLSQKLEMSCKPTKYTQILMIYLFYYRDVLIIVHTTASAQLTLFNTSHINFAYVSELSIKSVWNGLCFSSADVFDPLPTEGEPTKR